MNLTHPDQKPGLFTAIAVMTLTSGIINLFWGFVASATALGTIIGFVCLPLTILPTILGVFEIIYAAKLLSSQPEPIKPSPSIARVPDPDIYVCEHLLDGCWHPKPDFFQRPSRERIFRRINKLQVTRTPGNPPSPGLPPLPGHALPGELPNLEDPESPKMN